MDVPEATAGAEAHADWLELEALTARDRNTSAQDLIAPLRRTGSGEELEDTDLSEAASDQGGGTTEPLAEDAFAELEDRERSCAGAYPYDVRADLIQARRNVSESLYAFLLLLSLWGKDAAPEGLNATQLFEEVCERALSASMGGSDRGARTIQFGFPRRVAPKGFIKAVEDLCKQTGEGVAGKKQPKAVEQKDARLDLVGWREFPDGRRAQMMMWGQCATGGNWDTKLGDFLPDAWTNTWLIEQPYVLPLKAFFVPHRVTRDAWEPTSRHAGVLFDRCRIAALAGPLPQDLHVRVRTFNRHVLSQP